IVATIFSLCAISFLVYGNGNGNGNGNPANLTAYAQSNLQTIKHRNLVIDLGDGVKTNAQITYPAIGKGPFPGVLLIPGSGIADKNETLGLVHKSGPNPTTPLLLIAQYLSDRGFAILRYDKRGVGANHTILDTNVWGNVTADALIQDSNKALNVLMQQPEVDHERISIIGHSEGTIYAPRVAIDNPTKVKNIILMGTLAQNPVKDLYYYQVVILPSEYAKQVLDKNDTGLISIQQLATDPVVRKFLVPLSVLSTNNTEDITKALQKDLGTNDYLSIDKQLKPALIKTYENLTAFNSSKCNSLGPCPLWWKSVSSLTPNLGIIGNVSKSISILVLNGENDSQTPVEQAFLLQQRLTQVNHPDHTLITYPDLGHIFYPSSKWSTGMGPIEPYVLADLYAWLESHSGFTRIPVVMPSSNSS
ncbi:MAG TPA: alpha/beta fold hydrolase, partial [Nitrososphaeraceae archaeon]|nr:alpha/beta fold hydrolase [Nitrososphaeraceae archaeon]